jgi:hypothetical protein
MLHVDRTGSYCVRTSSIEEGVSVVKGALAKASAPVSGQDAVILSKTTISIDDVRDLHTFHDETSVSDQKTIICAGSFITTQAQNALLKMIEDTKEGERIFLVVGHETELLPTIISRVQTHVIQGSLEKDQVKKFVTQHPHERLTFFEQGILATEESDEKRELLLSFLRDLEEYLHGEGGVQTYKEILTAIPALRQMLQSPGAPVKMIAEYVALGF